MKRSDTLTLASALDALARDIESPDDVPALCLREAAERLRELEPCQYGWTNSILTEQRALREYAQAHSQLEKAEDILCDLASGYWQGVLGLAGSTMEKAERPMGERILDYWRDVEKTEPDFQHGGEASIDPAREKFFQKIRRHYGQPSPKEPPVSSNP
jgi:hypothetical protein